MSCKSQMTETDVGNLASNQPDLDITALTCPMTFVRVRLLLDRLAPGSVATLRLRGAEPRANIPHQLGRLGHSVVAFVPEDPLDAGPEAVWRLTFRRS
jgi:tRNA 2-thiouridine synthesizing protein A